MESGQMFAKITQMRQAAATINRSTTRMQDSMETIEHEVRALGPDRFMSLGAESFRGQYNRATPRIRETLEKLLRFKDHLNTAADDIEVASRSINTNG